MADLIEYKCPCCMGKIEFDSASQQMKCPFCGSEFELEALKNYDDALNEQPGESNMDWGSEAGDEWEQGEADGLRVYKCQSCGGEVVADETTAASKCPYCDNPVIMTGQFSGDLKPDYVLPFKLDKEAAKAALMKHMSGKPLLPKVFKEQNHIDEIKGVYIPVWLFDAAVDADLRFKGEKKRRWSDANFNYTEISTFSIIRTGSLSFANVPVDGSEKMDDTLMDSMEPFDFQQAVPFQTAYLSGYLADKYDVDAATSINRANERIRKSTVEEFRKTISGYESVEVESDCINLQNGEAKYALYPAWLLNTSWNGKKFTFAMNGQSGKFVGDLPADKGKAAIFFAIAALIGGLLGFLISKHDLLMTVIFALIAGGITFAILWGQLKSVVKQQSAADYVNKGSVNIRRRDEYFLYRKTDRQAKPKS